MDPINRYEDDSLAAIDALLAAVFPQIDPHHPESTQQHFATFWGEFIDARLANKSWTTADLSAALDCEPELVDDILSGRLPESEISDALLVEIAAALDYEPNSLRLLLGRKISPNPPHPAPPSKDIDDYLANCETEIQKLLDEISDLLFQSVDARYKRQLSDEHNSQYDFVIRQIEMIIAKQRADIKTVRILINELQTLDDSTDKNLQRPDLYRIIKFIKETI